MNFTNYHIATKQESTRVKNPGDKFYEATRFGIKTGINATLILSSQPNGQGNIEVDDCVKVTITNQCDPTNFAIYKHDFSNNCSTLINSIAPVNLTNEDGFSALQGQEVVCKIEFFDKCGNIQHGSDFYLCVGE